MENKQHHSSSIQQVWSSILSDLRRYHVTDNRSYLAMLILSPGTLTAITYRVGYWLWHYRGPARIVVMLYRPSFILVNRFVEIITGISITPRARIGPGLYIGHFGGIIVGADVVIGSNCNLSQGVTIGVGGRQENRGSPIIGNRVYIAPGAKVFGKIMIGNDVAIGANAVVTKSLPDRAVVVGIPAKILSYEGSFEFIHYAGMENDSERATSLTLREQAKSQIE